MQFIKRALTVSFKYCLLVLLLSTLAACSSVGIGGKKEKESEPVVTQTPGEEGEGVGFVVLPNPYQPGDVPAPAKREYAKAKALMEAKEWDQAQGVLELMVETYPKLSGPFVNLGIIHHQRDELDYAEKAFKYAIELNSLNFDAYTALGLLYREQGRFKEAENVYLTALGLWPHHLASTTNIGILYDLYMGRFDEALAFYELSQQISGGEDKQLKGWIIDLQRRMNSQ